MLWNVVLAGRSEFKQPPWWFSSCDTQTLHWQIKAGDEIWHDKRLSSGPTSAKPPSVFASLPKLWNLSSFFLSLCLIFSEAEAEPVKEPGERPSKRRCFWEYRRARETATKKKLGGDVHWSLSWSSSTLPSTLYRREGESTADPRRPSSLFVRWSVRDRNISPLRNVYSLSCHVTQPVCRQVEIHFLGLRPCLHARRYF